MRNMIRLFSAVPLLLWTGWALAESPRDLTERAFNATGVDKGTVLLHVNWGRMWGCGRYENAQLQELRFSKLGVGPDSASASPVVALSPGSTLLARNTFEHYAFVLDAGEYALSGFDVKLARSITDIVHSRGDPGRLIVDGKALGGSFLVAPSEITYIGHFTIDCGGEPILWRNYIDGRDEFDRYVIGFHKRYPFTKDVPVTYRLFATDTFGKPYNLN
jgi:hypothetical protein